MVGLTKLVRWVVAMSPHDRVELYTDAGFPAALRWAEMLGFTRETERPMRKYLPGGRDAHLFSRVK